MNEDREDEIKQAIEMYYDFDKEREVLSKMQKCQRNWDYDKFDVALIRYKTMLDELLYIAENSPSKQHEGYYDIYWSANRKVIQEMSRYTWGNTHRRNPPSNWRNSQANASIYIIYVAKQPDTQLNTNADGTLKLNSHPERWHNAYISIGISMGLVLRAANKMGFSTGCNKNMNDLNGNDYWEKKLGIVEQVKKGEMKLAYGIGIGYPREDMERWESEETELMIGAANGSKISLTNQEISPSEIKGGKKMRKALIVDIKESAGKLLPDPYGNIHTIPDKAEFKINSFRKRNIKVTEIK
tara:strand:+ start:1487 stop:2380 length:894 start_codon:yes stop_codon:yes gene_type:complete